MFKLVLSQLKSDWIWWMLLQRKEKNLSVLNFYFAFLNFWQILAWKKSLEVAKIFGRNWIFFSSFFVKNNFETSWTLFSSCCCCWRCCCCRFKLVTMLVRLIWVLPKFVYQQAMFFLLIISLFEPVIATVFLAKFIRT